MLDKKRRIKLKQLLFLPTLSLKKQKVFFYRHSCTSNLHFQYRLLCDEDMHESMTHSYPQNPVLTYALCSIRLLHRTIKFLNIQIRFAEAHFPIKFL